ncbi:MAG: type II secretion system major pseudopilin GspG [Nibricoccus sp.]
MTPSLSASFRRGLRQSRRAFTLLEILVVLAIIGLLATLAITHLDNITNVASEKTADIFVKQTLKVPLKTYSMTMGGYPSTAEGLQALITAPASKAGQWKGPYLETDGALPLDPWKEPYQYRSPGVKNKSGYDLWSKGPDKQDGTADDIGNWASSTETAK